MTLKAWVAGMSKVYRIVDDFQAGSTEIRILVLDREFDSFTSAEKWKAVVDGREYFFNLNSVRRWVTLQSRDSFTGKTVEFV